MRVYCTPLIPLGKPVRVSNSKRLRLAGRAGWTGKNAANSNRVVLLYSTGLDYGQWFGPYCLLLAGNNVTELVLWFAIHRLDCSIGFEHTLCRALV